MEYGRAGSLYRAKSRLVRSGGCVLLSTNGGSSFSKDNTGLLSNQASLSSSYIWAVSFSPGSKKGAAAVATSNGIYLSGSPGAAWTNISGNAVPKLFTDFAWAGGYLYAATYGEGIIRTAENPP